MKKLRLMKNVAMHVCLSDYIKKMAVPLDGSSGPLFCTLTLLLSLAIFPPTGFFFIALGERQNL